MSMLAEPRRKKGYILAPRGKPLYEDENSFGSRMLLKMGWSKGKGLGANEDGNQEFVRLKYKKDSMGLGFKDRDYEWTQHETNFDGLLKSLSNSAANSDSEQQQCSSARVGFGLQNEDSKQEESAFKISGESLEEKSKKSRARVHYKKFTRGKDISQYSEKDLANIFGKKSFISQINNSEVPKKCEENSLKKNGSAQWLGVTTISTGTSIKDYFKNKITKFKRGKSVTNEENGEVRPVENIDTNPGISINSSGKIEAAEEDESIKVTKLKKRKKENKRSDIIKDDNIEPITAASDTVSKKKKEMKRAHIDSKEIQNSDFEDNSRVKVKQSLKENNIIINDVTDTESNGTLKKKKRKNCETHPEKKQTDLQLKEEENITSSRKKKRRKSNDEQSVVPYNEENALNQRSNEDTTNLAETQTTEETKKRSKKRKCAAEGSNVKLESKAKDVEDETSLQTTADMQTSESGEKDIDNQSNVEECNLEDSKAEIEKCKLKKRKRKKEETSFAEKMQKTEHIAEHSQLIDANEQNVDVSYLNEENSMKKQCEQDEEGEEKNCKSSKKIEKNKKVYSNENSKNEISNNVEENTVHPESQLFVVEEIQKDDIDESKKKQSNIDSVKEDLSSQNDVSGQEKSEMKEDLINSTLSNENIYKINGFTAEKFRHTDIAGFLGSNFGEIIGYGMSKDTSVQVVCSIKDEQAIADMWYYAIDKYKSSQEVDKPEKRKTVNLKRFKKKKIFKFV